LGSIRDVQVYDGPEEDIQGGQQPSMDSLREVPNHVRYDRILQEIESLEKEQAALQARKRNNP
jgi:hypothetical protein